MEIKKLKYLLIVTLLFNSVFSQNGDIIEQLTNSFKKGLEYTISLLNAAIPSVYHTTAESLNIPGVGGGLILFSLTVLFFFAIYYIFLKPLIDKIGEGSDETIRRASILVTIILALMSAYFMAPFAIVIFGLIGLVGIIVLGGLVLFALFTAAYHRGKAYYHKHKAHAAKFATERYRAEAEAMKEKAGYLQQKNEYIKQEIKHLRKQLKKAIAKKEMDRLKRLLGIGRINQIKRLLARDDARSLSEGIKSL
ncbi:MAG: hypothetical protein ACPLX8_02455, partial [Nanopusillaceae archaeon]